MGKVCGVVLCCVCVLMIWTHSSTRNYISEYCVVECVGVLFSADLCQFPPTDGLPGSAHKQSLNGRIVAGAEVQTVGLLPPKHVDCLLWAGSPLPVTPPPNPTHARTHTHNLTATARPEVGNQTNYGCI